MPGMGHISGPVAGIDRGLLAMMNPHRNRPRKTIDASGPYIQWLEQSSTIWDVRDAPQPQPHSSSQRLVGDTNAATLLFERCLQCLLS